MSCNAILFALTPFWSSLCNHSFEDNIQHNGTKRSPLARGKEQSANARRLTCPSGWLSDSAHSGLTIGDTHLVENSGVESPDRMYGTACIIAATGCIANSRAHLPDHPRIFQELSYSTMLAVDVKCPSNKASLLCTFVWTTEPVII